MGVYNIPDMAIVNSEELSRFPQSGWYYREMIDLGEPRGECDYCGTVIRYCHIIWHPTWGTISVGAKCADRLTQDETASEKEKAYKKFLECLQRFLESKRWVKRKNGLFFTLKGFKIKIWDHETYCNLDIDYPVGKPRGRYQEYKTLKSKHSYPSIDAAKRKAFEIIEDGTLQKYIDKLD